MKSNSKSLTCLKLSYIQTVISLLISTDLSPTRPTDKLGVHRVTSLQNWLRRPLEGTKINDRLYLFSSISSRISLDLPDPHAILAVTGSPS